MDSAKKYIDDDSAFYLHRLDDFDLILKSGITLFIDEIESTGKPDSIDKSKPWSRFTDMTYVQYATASDKPNTLKDMLETSYYQCQISFDDIINPKTSNTKGNLINLAIEFGSLKSLETIINFCNDIQNKDNVGFSIDIENINGETPLIRAIHNQNTKACQLLLEKNASIFHKSEHNQFLLTPLRYLFQKATNLTVLTDVLFTTLMKNKKDFNQFLLEFASDDFTEFIKSINNDFANEFCKENSNIIKSQVEQLRCSKCKEFVGEEMKQCSVCNKEYCGKCFVDHDCPKCSFCNNFFNENDLKECPKCNRKLCSKCKDSHQCVRKCPGCKEIIEEGEEKFCPDCKRYFCGGCINDHICE